MFSVQIKKQIAATLLLAIIVISGSIIIPQQDTMNAPAAVETNGVFG